MHCQIGLAHAGERVHKFMIFKRLKGLAQSRFGIAIIHNQGSSMLALQALATISCAASLTCVSCVQLRIDVETSCLISGSGFRYVMLFRSKTVDFERADYSELWGGAT